MILVFLWMLSFADALKEILQLPVEKFQLYARSQDRNVGHVRTILMDNFCKSNFIVAPRVICLDAGLANKQVFFFFFFFLFFPEFSSIV